jgi:hypothetical protein
LNGECSILDHIERRAERIQADKNNEWRAKRERQHENNMKMKSDKENSEMKKIEAEFGTWIGKK